MNKPIHIKDLIKMFGLDPKDIPDPTPAPVPVMEKRLKDFKEKLKKAYRKKALELHPDKGGDEEKFKELDGYYRNIMNNLKIIPVQRRQHVQVIRVYSSSGTSTSTTSGWTSGHYWDTTE